MPDTSVACLPRSRNIADNRFDFLRAYFTINLADFHEQFRGFMNLYQYLIFELYLLKKQTKSVFGSLGKKIKNEELGQKNEKGER